MRDRADLRTLVIGVGLVLIVGSWLESRSRVNELQQQLVAKLAEADGYNKESRQAAGQARDTVRDLEYRLGMIESRVAETQNQRLALEALYLELTRSRDERVLAEVEQILLIASQQLQLAGNVKAALIALEAADSRSATRRQRAVQRTCAAPSGATRAAEVDALRGRGRDEPAPRHDRARSRRVPAGDVRASGRGQARRRAARRERDGPAGAGSVGGCPQPGPHPARRPRRRSPDLAAARRSSCARICACA